MHKDPRLLEQTEDNLEKLKAARFPSLHRKQHKRLLEITRGTDVPTSHVKWQRKLGAVLERQLKRLEKAQERAELLASAIFAREAEVAT